MSYILAISRFVHRLMVIFKWITYGLQGEKLQNLTIFFFSYFSFSTFETVCLPGWHCSIDLLVRYSSSKVFVQFVGLYFKTYPAMLFRLIFAYTTKLKLLNPLNDSLPSLTDYLYSLTLFLFFFSSKRYWVICVNRIRLYLTHSTLMFSKGL